MMQLAQPCHYVNFFRCTIVYIAQVSIQGEWCQWANKVPKIEVETHKVGSPDVVVPTLDTVRHESLLYTWLAEHRPMVLCGPPGSGKTMTLFSALRALPDMEVGVWFSHFPVSSSFNSLARLICLSGCWPQLLQCHNP